jgi:hypothetical protein
MEPKSSKDEKVTLTAMESEEIKLTLEELEEVIAPIVGPCTRK